MQVLSCHELSDVGGSHSCSTTRAVTLVTNILVHWQALSRGDVDIHSSEALLYKLSDVTSTFHRPLSAVQELLVLVE